MRHLRPAVAPPTNRVEERLMARVVAERPLPPNILQDPSWVVSIANALTEAIQGGPLIPVATDGSSKDAVGAWSIILPGVGKSFAGPLWGEDQGSFRAEVISIWLLPRALLSLNPVWPDKLQIYIICDCTAALATLEHGSSSVPLLGRDLLRMTSLCRERRIELHTQWAPAHDRHVPLWKPSGPVDELCLRRWNRLADRKANSEASRWLLNSQRAVWSRQRSEAQHWEDEVIQAMANIASHYASL